MTNTDRVGALLVIIIILILGFFTFGYVEGSKDGREAIRSTEFVVESANIEEVTTNIGLVIQNDGFHVGDTLVIIKK